MTPEQSQELRLAELRLYEAEKALSNDPETAPTTYLNRAPRVELILAKRGLKNVLIKVNIPERYQYLFL